MQKLEKEQKQQKDNKSNYIVPRILGILLSKW